MNCRRVNALLSAYLDGELTGFEMLQIRDHIARCSDCREEQESLQSIKSMLAALPQHDPDPTFKKTMNHAV